ncbi:MAG: hypothetical protein JWM57_3103 [Phycisphaerales bacterium]|nr:hypothetical protein [Phycisphaerales bacterium]
MRRVFLPYSSLCLLLSALSPMNCPICKKPLPEPLGEQPFFPFCSERCKLVDLGRWLDGKYQIPVTPPADEDEQN